MEKMVLAGLTTVTVISILAGCANTPEGESARRGAKYGAMGGAALGLGLGALTGDASFAAAGAAAGAMAGAGAGAMYEYDQHRDDNRTKMLADSIGGAKAGETVDDAGKRHLEDFIGQWNINIWALQPDGNRVTATGTAKAVMNSRTTVTITYDEIEATGSEDDIEGTFVFEYDPDNGFALTNEIEDSGEKLTFVGEYIPDGNKYNFYLTSGDGGTMAGGQTRSNMRLEIRVSGQNMWVAETFTLIDGKEVQAQSYRFTRK